jgi:two-component system CheB/CheR fusion protein
MCIFARQNVLADPPFSRLDLVACRNMLIYLDPALQQRVIPLLHYALRSDGFLWLGNSETIGSYRDLFEVVDPRHKVYAKKPDGRRSGNDDRWAPRANSRGRGSVSGRAEIAALDPQREADRLLLSRYAPAGVMLDDELEIVQFRGDTSPYLSPRRARRASTCSRCCARA